MIISITGHRPKDLPYKYEDNNPFEKWVKKQLKLKFKEFGATKIISGMALGVDTFAADVALEMNIPLLAAIPFVGQEKMWLASSIKKYNDILSKASEKVIVSEGSYTASKMQIRNQWMVDNSNILIGVYNGSKTGGTYNCLTYAHSENKIVSIVKVGDFKQ